MKKLVFIIITITLLFACKSSSKQLEDGNYDAALQKAAKKIKKNPGKFEEVDTFNDAYRMAYTQNDNEVTRLKSSGDPSNWRKIHSIYLQMKKRQDLAASLPPVGINYTERDFSTEIELSRNKALEYAYEIGNQLLSSTDRFQVRKAYANFLEVKKYSSNYKDVDEKLKEAKYFGMTNIFFRIENNAEIVAPKGMMEALQNIDINDIDQQWINYETFVDTNKQYHYSIILNMKLIEVSPEGLKETETVERKRVEGGFDYVLDANGNVKKDSLGNDIKTVKYKTISCRLKRFQQIKSAQISGTIDYYDNLVNRRMKSEPITSEALFESFHAQAFGDLNALSVQTRQGLNVEPLPFPRNDVLIVQAGEILKSMTKDILVKNKNYLK